METHPLIAALIDAADLPSDKDPGHAKAKAALLALSSHVLGLLERHVTALERLADSRPKPIVYADGRDVFEN